ncbi:hypothetical protein [Gordonibacter sp. An230]|uniref:hypothetical protein n=1 Tax=Gordonibacter sp. An230 TaxID=1965592 RepID=UPI000B39B3A8|nr:hypothetical protein [Gordonibacter sp. An230]
MSRMLPRMALALATVQLTRVRGAGVALPVAIGVLIACVGASASAIAGVPWARVASVAFVPLHSLAVGIGALSVLSGDALVELHGSTPFGVRAVQTARGALLALAGTVGALAMFAPLHALGVVYGDIGWASALSPVCGAVVLALTAYAVVAIMESPRAAAFFVVLAWVVLSFFWDPNLAGDPVLQRAVPMALALAAAAGAWLSLGSPERACAKAVGAR